MKGITFITISISALMLTTGCASRMVSDFRPPPGFIVTSYDAPICLNLQETPVMEQGGDASSYFIWDVILTRLSVAWGDCSLEEANCNHKKSVVGAADYHYFSVLGIWQKTTVTVYNQ